MYKILLIILINITCLAGYSQTLDSLVMSVERNNPNIKAQENWLKAGKLKSRIGIYPDNPRVAYQYLWGNSNEYGDQKELEVIQSFRLPMYYTQKSTMQNLRYDQDEMLVEGTKNEILHQARVEYFSLAWLVKKDSLLSERLLESERLVSMLESGFEKNEIPRLVLDISFIDTVAAMISSIVIIKWSIDLLKGAGKVLLDIKPLKNNIGGN
jgi:hypothetical protein